VNFKGVKKVESNSALTFSDNFDQATTYEICYSTDDQQTWVSQTLVSVTARPPAAVATSIQAIYAQSVFFSFLFLFLFFSLLASIIP